MEQDFLAPTGSKSESLNLGPSLSEFEKSDGETPDQDFLPPSQSTQQNQNDGINVPYDATIAGGAIGAAVGSASRAGYIDNIKRAIDMALMEGKIEKANELYRLAMSENIKLKTMQELPQGVDRQFQGTIDGGETGRARQTGYHTRTAAEAERLKEMKAAQAATEVPKPTNPLTTQAWKSTPGGVLAPVDEADFAQKRYEMELRQKAQLDAAQKLEQEREALMRTQKMSQIPAWQRIFGSKITGLGLGALGGATAGHELYKAVEEGKQGDYLGSALSGLTGLGGMAAMVPNPVVAGIGGALAAGIPIARELVPRNIESMKRLANRPRGEAPTPAEIAEASSAYYGRGALPRKRTMIAGID